MKDGARAGANANADNTAGTGEGREVMKKFLATGIALCALLVYGQLVFADAVELTDKKLVGQLKITVAAEEKGEKAILVYNVYEVTAENGEKYRMIPFAGEGGKEEGRLELEIVAQAMMKAFATSFVKGALGFGERSYLGTVMCPVESSAPKPLKEPATKKGPAI